MSKVDETVVIAGDSHSGADKAATPKRRWLTLLKDASVDENTTPGPPPDGGWVAWRQVLGGFLVNCLCWGFINSFGLFQLYYSTSLIVGTPPSAISWIGPLQLFFLMFIGAYSGSIADSGYFRATCVVGAFFFVLGVFMTSICTQFWQLMLAHGVCTGVGNGFIFIPSISTASTYFSKRRSLAISLMFCGSAVGGMVLPVIFNHLLPKIGFGWTMRIFGFIALGVFAVAIKLMRKRLPPKDDVRILTIEALKDKAFVLFLIGFFMDFLGLFFAFFYLPSFARNVLGLDFVNANNLLLVINGVALPGRILPAWLADQRQWKGVRPLTVVIPVNVATGIMLFAWIGIKTEVSAYIFAVIYGFAAAGLQVLFPASLAEMTTDAKKSGAQIGWGFTICSFACLLGNPIGGLILQAAHNNYTYPQIYGGTCLLIGSVITAAAARSKIIFEARILHSSV